MSRYHNRLMKGRAWRRPEIGIHFGNLKSYSRLIRRRIRQRICRQIRGQIHRTRHLLLPHYILFQFPMVNVSKTAIKCPSSNYGFPYFTSGPDPADKLRNHFNNFKKCDNLRWQYSSGTRWLLSAFPPRYASTHAAQNYLSWDEFGGFFLGCYLN